MVPQQAASHHVEEHGVDGNAMDVDSAILRPDEVLARVVANGEGLDNDVKKHAKCAQKLLAEIERLRSVKSMLNEQLFIDHFSTYSFNLSLVSAMYKLFAVDEEKVEAVIAPAGTKWVPSRLQIVDLAARKWAKAFMVKYAEHLIKQGLISR